MDDARTRVSFPLIADHVLLGRSEGVEAADAAASVTLTGNVLTQILAEVPDALLVDSERPGGLGVIVHARTVEFLGLRVITDPGVLRARLPGMDHELLAHYLQTYQALCAGDPSAGPLALAPPSERFTG